MQRVDVTHEYALPAERVYAYLGEHKNLEPLFGARIRRVRDGDSHYVIEFGAAVPGLAKVVQVGLVRNIERGLRKVERLA